MLGFFRAVDRQVETRGTVDEHTGDCVMAVFGAPVAHDNDCERAVRAAIAIHHVALPAVSGRPDGSSRLTSALPPAKWWRVAAAAPGRTFALTGQSVNLGARLADAAAPGETLISKTVWQTVSDLILAEDKGQITVKGLERPVGTWKVLGVRMQPGTDQTVRRTPGRA